MGEVLTSRSTGGYQNHLLVNLLLPNPKTVTLKQCSSSSTIEDGIQILSSESATRLMQRGILTFLLVYQAEKTPTIGSTVKEEITL